MTNEVLKLKKECQLAKTKFLSGKITKLEAQKAMKPYIDLFNKTAKEKAEKFKVKPKLVSFNYLINSIYF